MKVLSLIKKAFHSNSIDSANEKYEDAKRVEFQMESNLVFLNKMHRFYLEKSELINHKEDWWGYARTRDKETEYKQLLERETDRFKDARARTEARKSALEMLLDK